MMGNAFAEQCVASMDGSVLSVLTSRNDEGLTNFQPMQDPKSSKEVKAESVGTTPGYPALGTDNAGRVHVGVHSPSCEYIESMSTVLYSTYSVHSTPCLHVGTTLLCTASLNRSGEIRRQGVISGFECSDSRTGTRAQQVRTSLVAPFPSWICCVLMCQFSMATPQRTLCTLTCPCQKRGNGGG